MIAIALSFHTSPSSLQWPSTQEGDNLTRVSALAQLDIDKSLHGKFVSQSKHKVVSGDIHGKML